MQVLNLGKQELDVGWRGQVAFVGRKGQRIGVGGGTIEEEGWVMGGLAVGEGFVEFLLQGLQFLGGRRIGEGEVGAERPEAAGYGSANAKRKG